MGNISLKNIPKGETKTFLRIKELIDLSTDHRKLARRPAPDGRTPFGTARELDYVKMHGFIGQIRRHMSLESATQ